MSLLAATLFLASPAPVPAAAHEEAAAIMQRVAAPADTPKSIWRVDAAGTATHLQSTMPCPAKIGTLERTILRPFDGFGFDIGCNYDSESVGRISVYLTRRKNRALADDFAGAQAALKQVMPDAAPVAGASPAPTGFTFTGALYSRTDGTKTGVWLADVSGWTFKLRATYFPAKEQDVLSAMTELATKAKATAAPYLATCVAAQPVVRDGKLVTESSEIMMLTLIGTVDTKDMKTAEHWCAEDVIAEDKAPLLFWRNVANTTLVGPVDRLSLMTIEEPPMWPVIANGLTGFVEDDDNKPTPYSLIEKVKTATFTYAFYRGRPALSTLSPLVIDIVSGKAKPIAAVDGETISIAPPADEPGS
jgi:hypothetical protein